jgi:hypothetical protein
MKKRLSLLLVALIVLSSSIITSCSEGKVSGSGNIVEEQRDVSDFKEIHVSGIGNLVVNMGDEESLRIKADENFLRRIKSEVKGDRLRIKIERGFTLDPAEPIYYYVTAKELDIIAFAGSGSVQTGKMNAEDFSLKLAGAANGKIDSLVSDSLEVEIGGSGDVEIKDLHTESLEVDIAGSGNTVISGGEAGEQDINIAGSGKYEALNLQSVRADLNLAGSGYIALKVSEQLEVNIIGSGSVKYFGNPKVETNIMGSGTVKGIEERVDAGESP